MENQKEKIKNYILRLADGNEFRLTKEQAKGLAQGLSGVTFSSESDSDFVSIDGLTVKKGDISYIMLLEARVEQIAKKPTTLEKAQAEEKKILGLKD